MWKWVPDMGLGRRMECVKRFSDEGSFRSIFLVTTLAPLHPVFSWEVTVTLWCCAQPWNFCKINMQMLKPWNPWIYIFVTFFKSELVMLRHISGPQDTSEHEVHSLKLASETKQKFTDKALLKFLWYSFFLLQGFPPRDKMWIYSAGAVEV